MDQPRPVCWPSYGAAGSLVLVSTTSVPCSLWERRGRRHARMSARSLLTILVISAPRSTISGSSKGSSQKQSHSVPGAECQIAPSWTFSTLGVPEGRCRRSEASAIPDQQHVPSFGDPRHRTSNRRERSLTREAVNASLSQAQTSLAACAVCVRCPRSWPFHWRRPRRAADIFPISVAGRRSAPRSRRSPNFRLW
jgi:hypothetical protein